jgi:prepilin-type N-terminal cleavage/methylation domain-containing protein
VKRLKLSRAGVALLEIMIALVILGIVMTAVLGQLQAATRASERSLHSERQVLEASRFLEYVALWTRKELEQRLGDRHQGPWFLTIQRLTPTLFHLSLRDTLSQRSLVGTIVYRPTQTSAGP